MAKNEGRWSLLTILFLFRFFQICFEERDRLGPALLGRFEIGAVFSGLLAKKAVAGADVDMGKVRLFQLGHGLRRGLNGCGDARRRRHSSQDGTGNFSPWRLCSGVCNRKRQRL